MDEIKDKVNALESILLEKSKNNSTGNNSKEYSIYNRDCERHWIFTGIENSSNDEISKVDERLMISKDNIPEKKWNDMNSNDVPSTTETIYSISTKNPN